MIAACLFLQDISNMSRSEFVSLVQDRGAFGIRRALIDMGVTIDTTKAYGSVASVREAVAVYGLKKRVLHMAELLSEPAVLKEASLHPLGNLAVQVCKLYRIYDCYHHSVSRDGDSDLCNDCDWHGVNFTTSVFV